MIAKELLHDATENRLWFFCPGCNFAHSIAITGPRAWKYNGNVEKPTVDPSILVTMPTTPIRCHSYVTDGQIRFLDDCWHVLRGHTVPLPELPQWLAED